MIGHRILAVVVAMGAVAALAAESFVPRNWNFECDAIGQTPANWKEARTGAGPGSVWRVVEDVTAPAGSRTLMQTSAEGPKKTFNLCVADDTRLANVDLRVAMKAREGKIDQGGGLVWRYQDAENYYVARLNPLELNFRVYKIVQGKRTQLATADSEAAAKQWHTMRVVHRGDHIKCYLNGKLELDVKDGEISAPGKIGLWTKADAVTSFDNLQSVDPQ